MQPLTAATLLLAAASGLWLYQVKHRAEALDGQIARVLGQIAATRERIGRKRQKPGALRRELDGLLAKAIAPVQHRSPDLKHRVGAERCPAHLLALVHARADQVVDRAFGPRGRDRLARPVALAVVDQRALVVADVGVQLRAVCRACAPSPPPQRRSRRWRAPSSSRSDRSHDALVAAIRVAEAGGDVAVPEFDYEAFLTRLGELGESLDHRRAETLRPALTVAAEGPLSGIAADPRHTDEREAVRCLRAGLALLEASDWEDAAAVLSEAITLAPDTLRPRIVAALEGIAERSETAAANLALALLTGDGVAQDVARAEAMLRRLTRSVQPHLAAHAHNWLAHVARGAFGTQARPRDALAHFEQAAELGGAEAAYNAALLHQEGAKGVPKSLARARALYRRGADLGHVPSMTNLAGLIMDEDPDEGLVLLEQAEAAGDENAAAMIRVIMEQGMALAIEPAQHAPGGDTPPLLPVRVVPAGEGRPRAVAAALRQGSGCPVSEAEQVTAFLYGFGSWRELLRAAEKGAPDRPDEACDPAELLRRRTYQVQALMMCSDMDARTAKAVIEELRPTA